MKLTNNLNKFVSFAVVFCMVFSGLLVLGPIVNEVIPNAPETMNEASAGGAGSVALFDITGRALPAQDAKLTLWCEDTLGVTPDIIRGRYRGYAKFPAQFNEESEFAAYDLIIFYYRPNDYFQATYYFRDMRNIDSYLNQLFAS